MYFAIVACTIKKNVSTSNVWHRLLSC